MTASNPALGGDAESNLARAEAAMLQHIASNETFTFRQLWSAGDRSIGADSGTAYRWADRLIQRERKAGRIEETGKRGVWAKARGHD